MKNVMAIATKKIQEFNVYIYNLPEKAKTAITGFFLACSFLCAMASASVIDASFDLMGGFLWFVASILLFLPGKHMADLMILDDEEYDACDDEDEEDKKPGKIICYKEEQKNRVY